MFLIVNGQIFIQMIYQQYKHKKLIAIHNYHQIES